MWRRLAAVWSSPRAVLRGVLSLDDTSHAIALGAAVGMAIGMTPTVGVQTLIVLAIVAATHRLFYFNRAAALLLIYVSNPFTVVPIYWCLYQVGTQFVPGTATMDSFRQILSFEGLAGWWQTVQDLTFQVGAPLAVGTLVVAPVAGGLMYPITWLLLKWYRGADPSKPETTSGDRTEAAAGNPACSSPHTARKNVIQASSFGSR